MKTSKLYLVLAACCSLASAATINFDVSPQVQSGLPGTVLLFQGTITNATGAAVTASDIFFSFSDFDASNVSLTAIVGVPDFTLPNGATSGVIDLFTFALGDSAAAGTYRADVVLEDVRGDVSPVVTVAVTTAPEPGPFSLLAISGAIFAIRLRSKIKSLTIMALIAPCALLAQRATLITEMPGIYSEGNRLYLAIPIGNLGPSTAQNVRVTEIRIASGAQLTPTSLPAPVGDISVEDSAVLNASFSLAGDPAGTRLPLTISGLYEVAGQTLGFSLNRILVVKQPGGTFTAHSARLPSRVFRGGPFPVQQFPGPGQEHEQGEVPPVPIGPFRAMQPGSDFTLKNLAFNQARARVVAPRSAGDPIIIKSNSQYASNAGDPPDMSGASGRGVVLATANTFISVSTDDGVTFKQVNPTTVFPDVASPGRDASGNLIDNGLCCDQSVRYLPSIDRFIWLMQFNLITAPGGGQINKLRVAVASPGDILSKGVAGDGVWTAWDMTSATFQLGEDWMDFPDIAVGDSSAYICVNKVNIGGFVIRMPLAQLRDGTTLDVNYTEPNAYTKKMTRFAGDTMYWADCSSTSSLDVYSWREDSNQYHLGTVPIRSLSTDFTAPDPSGKEWINPRNSGPLLLYTASGATRRYAVNPFTGEFIINEIWFAFSNGRTATSPYPSVRLTRIDAGTFGIIQEIDIRNNEHAFALPDLASSQDGGLVGSEIGFTFQWGGNKFYGTPGVGLFALGAVPGQMVSPENTDLVAVATSDASPLDRSGDYLTVVTDFPSSGAFSGFNYAIVSDPAQPAGWRWDCRAIRFGHASAFSGPPR